VIGGSARGAAVAAPRHCSLPAWCLPAILVFILLCPATGRAQGCSACRDATAGSAPRAREGLRRGILVLGVPAGGICLAVFLVARRIEQRRDW